MKQLGEFLKNTFTAGLLVLFPLFASVFLMVQVASLLTSVLKPLLLNIVPETQIVGVAILILFLLCFVVGLLVRTRVGGNFALRLNELLKVIPGYRVFVSIAHILFDREDASGTPVVVQRCDSRQIGFMIEQTNSEEMTLYFPDAPGLFSGTGEIIKASSVQRLKGPAGQSARVIAAFGAGPAPFWLIGVGTGQRLKFAWNKESRR